MLERWPPSVDRPPPPPPVVEILKRDGLVAAVADDGLVATMEDREGTPDGRELSEALDTDASVVRLRDAIVKRLLLTAPELSDPTRVDLARPNRSNSKTVQTSHAP